MDEKEIERLIGNLKWAIDTTKEEYSIDNLKMIRNVIQGLDLEIVRAIVLFN